ncbi:MAG: gamma-glutamylcyclotransferase [Proteobacteria bacterium]|nr:gamma-glutamylcyclotransferase [Pseudomonadota bacterium]
MDLDGAKTVTGKAQQAAGPRSMDLTPELVARVHRALADEGPDPSLAYHDDADYAAITAEMLARHAAGRPCWLFAYGSLIWKPEVPHVDERRGTALGYHRAFCFRVQRFRGTRAQPGLMMALDRGGQCSGMLYRLPDENLPGHVEKLFRREFTVKPPNCRPHWVRVASPEGTVDAIAFVMNRTSPNYLGKLPPEEIADILSAACGHWGSCAEYLYQTVAHLEAKGIHDRHLWLLQRLVAERISARPSP